MIREVYSINHFPKKHPPDKVAGMAKRFSERFTGSGKKQASDDTRGLPLGSVVPSENADLVSLGKGEKELGG
jgi:hypothetical protein